MLSRFPSPLRWSILMIALTVAICGCGSTRVPGGGRGASEELLLSLSIDRAVGKLNLAVLAGHAVFLDAVNLGEVSYTSYLTGALRQHLLASGARLVDSPDDATVIVEARAGAVATARHDTLVGIPETTVPAVVLGAAATLPEVAVVKKTLNIGVAKVGVFAYRADNGVGVWQSGMRESQSVSQDNWYLGVGPFQSGDVVVDGQLGRPPGLVLSAGRRQGHSSLECQRWTGEPPPFELPPPLAGSSGEAQSDGGVIESAEKLESAQEIAPGLADPG